MISTGQRCETFCTGAGPRPHRGPGCTSGHAFIAQPDPGRALRNPEDPRALDRPELTGHLGGDPVEQMERRTLSVSEAARVLGISRAHAYDCVRTGELPSISLGRRVVVPRQAIEELLARGSSDDSAALG